MGKVLKSDASADWAWVEKDLGSGESEVWVTYRLAFDAASLATWSSNTVSSDFDELFEATHTTQQDAASIINFGTLNWATFFGSSGTPVADITHTVEHHLLNGGAGAGVSQLYVDGVLVAGATGLTVASVRYVRMGLAPADPGNPIGGVNYIGGVMIGTTRGASDLFADDFSSGDLTAWTSTFGDVSVVNDPFAPVFTLPGVFDVAFTDPTLEAFPTWTAL